MRVAQSMKQEVSRGAWTAEEDRKLAQVIEIHGPKRWKSVAAKAGLNRCGKSCRLRWMNYLRPNIKRGNISDQEEDLILRLHKLLGNRWSLIAGRLPGRTDNEIKNYWNSHLCKKLNDQKENIVSSYKQQCDKVDQSTLAMSNVPNISDQGMSTSYENSNSNSNSKSNSFTYKELVFDEEPLNLEWMSRFIDLDESWFDLV
ncbi:hypothetical protein ACFE04_018909 [Oxalis oulophora]